MGSNNGFKQFTRIDLYRRRFIGYGYFKEQLLVPPFLGIAQKALKTVA
jgi:hypothetical protein